MIKNNTTQHTIKDLIAIMEDAGENKDFIIGWMSSMIGYFATSSCSSYTLQDEIDSGIRYYKDKALRSGRQAVLS
jgi:hypothetical protein